MLTPDCAKMILQSTKSKKSLIFLSIPGPGINKKYKKNIN